MEEENKGTINNNDTSIISIDDTSETPNKEEKNDNVENKSIPIDINDKSDDISIEPSPEIEIPMPPYNPDAEEKNDIKDKKEESEQDEIKVDDSNESPVISVVPEISAISEIPATIVAPEASVVSPTPVTPVTLVTPEIPVVPPVPVTPVTPEVSVVPSAPVTPVTPEVSVVPPAPVTPVTPEVSVVPPAPVTPVTPEVSVVPPAPVTPVTPEVSVVPSAPVTPVTPEMPAVPPVPSAPIVASIPANAIEPATPTVTPMVNMTSNSTPDSLTNNVLTNESVNKNEDDNKKEKSKKKLLFIICGAVAAIIIIVIVLVLVLGNKKTNENDDNKTSNTNKPVEKTDEISSILNKDTITVEEFGKLESQDSASDGLLNVKEIEEQKEQLGLSHNGIAYFIKKLENSKYEVLRVDDFSDVKAVNIDYSSEGECIEYVVLSNDDIYFVKFIDDTYHSIKLDAGDGVTFKKIVGNVNSNKEGISENKATSTSTIIEFSDNKQYYVTNSITKNEDGTSTVIAELKEYTKK